jgi:hypothetical protein
MSRQPLGRSHRSDPQSEAALLHQARQCLGGLWLLLRLHSSAISPYMLSRTRVPSWILQLGWSMAGTCRFPWPAFPGLLDAKSPRQVDKRTLHALSPLTKGSLSRYLLLVTSLRTPRLTWRSNSPPHWIFPFGDNPSAPCVT